MNKKTVQKTAFSLFEISLVILIVSVIIAGVTQTNNMIAKSRLASAQVLTQNSIVNNLDNILAWYETSLDSSFISSEIGNGNAISTWYDNNPKAINKNNATQSTASLKPTYVTNAINGGIPVIRSPTSSKYLNFNGTQLAQSAYTIFVVEQRRSSTSSGWYLGGTTGSNNSILILGYRYNSVLTQAHWANDLDATIPVYSSPAPLITTYVFDTTNGKSIWVNGTLKASSAQLTPLTSYNGAMIVSPYGSYYVGDIAEIIIFKTRLNSETRKSVEIYLGKKYGITIS